MIRPYSPLKHTKERGFTFFEVLIAVVVTAMGLFGLAKMQALAISSTKVSGTRSLVALQVASLASAMHANKAYWASGSAPAAFSATGTTITDPSNVLSATVRGACTTFCTQAAMAANDVQTWVKDMNTQFPTYNAKVTCTNNTNQPVSCQIYVTWTENNVAMNQTTVAARPTETQSFSVFVKP